MHYFGNSDKRGVMKKRFIKMMSKFLCSPNLCLQNILNVHIIYILFLFIGIFSDCLNKMFKNKERFFKVESNCPNNKVLIFFCMPATVTLCLKNAKNAGITNMSDATLKARNIFHTGRRTL